MKIYVQKIFCVIMFILVAVMFGCGGNNIGIGKVTGVVTLDGVPLQNAAINFIPTDGQGLNSMGGTNSSGKYEIFYADKKSGAVPGRYKVTLTTAQPMENIPEQVPQKYVDFSTTDLEYEIKAGKNVIDIKLTSKN
ncbi:MAG: hypothetical protein LBE18_10300 [Planctomycetaceae bacterium]|jgi:hypothetical protein|nr:hypothetical protein [Planctomycetaceae bacterium]